MPWMKMKRGNEAQRIPGALLTHTNCAGLGPGQARLGDQVVRIEVWEAYRSWGGTDAASHDLLDLTYPMGSGQSEVICDFEPAQGLRMSRRVWN